MKTLRQILLTALCVGLWFQVLGVPALDAQGPKPSVLQSAANAYLALTGQNGTQAYVAHISSSHDKAWNAGVVTLASPPQMIGGLIPTGFGQVVLPTIGPVTPTGSYTQDLVIPSGIPLFGNWNTGIKTTVNTYVDRNGNRVEAAVDPLSAFNYALTHANYDTNQQTGFALIANALGQWLGGTSAAGNDGALRLDPGLVIALNSNYGQGLGNLFGVGVYVYETPSGTVGGQAANLEEPPAGPPTLPPLPLPVPGPTTEEVYLKAVIPQPAPEFTLEFQPPYPVVVGQDPTQRGVDVLGRATLGPCTVIWHHVLREEYIFCGKEKCDCTKDHCEIRVNIREWDTTELEPDALAAATVEAVLSPESVAYIQGELARIYPGARVYQGRVQVYTSQWARLVENHIGIPSTWAFLAERVPFADPGKWDFGVSLTTTGTPHCGPLNWSKDFPQILTVWLREQRLVK